MQGNGESKQQPVPYLIPLHATCSQGFEGDMQQLTNYTAALATLLDAARSAGGGAPLELVRKESLAGADAGGGRV